MKKILIVISLTFMILLQGINIKASPIVLPTNEIQNWFFSNYYSSNSTYYSNSVQITADKGFLFFINTSDNYSTNDLGGVDTARISLMNSSFSEIATLNLNDYITTENGRMLGGAFYLNFEDLNIDTTLGNTEYLKIYISYNYSSENTTHTQWLIDNTYGISNQEQLSVLALISIHGDTGTAYEEGYTNGDIDGYNTGYEEGYDIGYLIDGDDFYASGYYDGRVYGEANPEGSVLLRGFFTLIGILINFALMILTQSIFDINLWSVFLIGVVIVIPLWILKLIRG